MTPQMIAMMAVPIFRAAGFLMTSPFFRLQAVPKVARFTLAISLAMCVWFSTQQLGATGASMTTSWSQVGMVAIWEAMIGLILGGLCSLVFLPIKFISAVLTEGLGANLAAVVDPSQPDQNSSVSELLELLAMGIFFAGDFHLYMLEALVRFMRFPDATPEWLARVGETEMMTFVAGHRVGLALASVLIAGFFLSSLAAMLVNRASPSMNFFSVGQGMRTAFGIVMLAFVLPGIAQGLVVLWKQSISLLEYLLPLTA